MVDALGEDCCLVSLEILSCDLKGRIVHFFVRWRASASARHPQRRAGQSEKPARRALSRPVGRRRLILRAREGQGAANSPPRSGARPQNPALQRDVKNSPNAAIAFDNKRIYTQAH